MAAVVGGGLAVAGMYIWINQENKQLADRWGSPYRAEVISLSPVQKINLTTSEGTETHDARKAEVKLVAGGKASHETLWLVPDSKVGDRYTLWRDAGGNLTDDPEHITPVERYLLYALSGFVAGYVSGVAVYVLVSVLFALISIVAVIRRLLARNRPQPGRS